MRRSLLALALVVVASALGAGTARAQLDPLTRLHDELVGRRDNDYAGALDKAHKKELKAVVKALAVLDEPVEKLADRIKSATTVGKVLAKAFPAEFPKATVGLQSLMLAVAAALRDSAEIEYASLATLVPGIRTRVLHDRAEAQRVAAREDLDLAAAATDPLDALAILKNAAKEIAKGLAYAAKDPFVETVSATLEFTPAAAAPFTAQNTTVTYAPATTALFIDGNHLTNGKFLDVRLSSSNLDPITGPGTFAVTAFVYSGTDPVTIEHTYYTNTATLTITTFDLAGKHIAGTFSFNAIEGFGPGAPTVIATNGVLDVKKFTVE